MKQKNLTGIFTFRNVDFPEWFAYSNDATGKNINAHKDGKATTWTPSANVFYFTEAQEKEIDEKVANLGYCIFQSRVATILSEWQIK